MYAGKRIPSFDAYINESVIWDDAYGNPRKIHKEIQVIIEEALPSNILNNIGSYGAEWGKRSMNTPHTTSNKGISTGTVDYTVVEAEFKKPIGKYEATSMLVGLRKRTSGPGTGYIAVSLKIRKHTQLNSPTNSVAIEFYGDPAESLQELFNKEIAKLLK